MYMLMVRFQIANSVTNRLAVLGHDRFELNGYLNSGWMTS